MNLRSPSGENIWLTDKEKKIKKNARLSLWAFELNGLQNY